MIETIRTKMVKFPFVADPSLSLKDAAVYMHECGIRHLPIIEDDEIIGVVSERDLKEFSGNENYQLRDVMSTPPFIVPHTETIKNVVDMMIENKLGCALVCNRDNQLVGIFTTIDALKYLSILIDIDDQEPLKIDRYFSIAEASGWN